MKFSQESLSPGAEKKKKISEKKMSQEAVFVQNEGVAHIGPEFKNVSNEIPNTEEEKFIENVNIKEKNNEKEDLNYRHKSRVEKFFGKNLVNATSKFRYLISKNAVGTESKSEDRKNLRTNTKDNLKTISESKKERNKRGEIREVLHDPKNWEESGKKSDLMDSIEE